MGELRTSVLIGRTVVIAPRRGLRPQEGRDPTGSQPKPPDRDPACPFCPGNESELPDLLWERPAPNPPGWSMRAVPNRFPAFEPSPASAGSVRASPARGRQEVLIESADHGRDPSRMTRPEFAAVVSGYEERVRVVAEDVGIERVLLFRNHGREAGASLRHPHAQIVGTGFLPPEVRRVEKHLRSSGRAGGGCLLCRLPDVERGWPDLVVRSTERFHAFVPWAAEAPHEVWIVPRRHRSFFRLSSGAERDELAALAGDVLEGYRTSLGDPAYNLLVRTGSLRMGDDPFIHWWLQIRPRAGHPAGFELGSGLLINPSSPEEDAAALRGVLDRIERERHEARR